MTTEPQINEPGLDIDEAEILRTAAAIVSLLGDYQMHPWRHCIELARDYTGGDRRAASELAWRALIEFIGDDVTWDGPKGARRIGLLPTPAMTRAVACPRCGVQAGHGCVKLNSGGGPKVWPHEEREAAAVRVEVGQGVAR